MNLLAATVICFLTVVSTSLGRQLTSYPCGKCEPGPAEFKPSAIEDLSLPKDDSVVLQASVARRVDRESGETLPPDRGIQPR